VLIVGDLTNGLGDEELGDRAYQARALLRRYWDDFVVLQ
jgi:hypothetical protein